MRAVLIHPVAIVLVQTTGGTVDADFGETVGAPTTSTVTLQGQVKMVSPDKLRMTGGGANPLASAVGHVAFETAALATAGVTISQGDRITAFGPRVVSYRVVAVRDAGEYGGTYSLLLAFFAPEG